MSGIKMHVVFSINCYMSPKGHTNKLLWRVFSILPPATRQTSGIRLKTWVKGRIKLYRCKYVTKTGSSSDGKQIFRTCIIVRTLIPLMMFTLIDQSFIKRWLENEMLDPLYLENPELNKNITTEQLATIVMHTKIIAPVVMTAYHHTIWGTKIPSCNRNST